MGGKGGSGEIEPPSKKGKKNRPVPLDKTRENKDGKKYIYVQFTLSIPSPSSSPSEE